MTKGEISKLLSEAKNAVSTAQNQAISSTTQRNLESTAAYWSEQSRPHSTDEVEAHLLSNAEAWITTAIEKLRDARHGIQERRDAAHHRMRINV